MKTMSRYLTIAVIALLSLTAFNATANNIQIQGKPVLDSIKKADTTMQISFRLTWDNSWRSNTPANYDAAWVFVKYDIGGMGWEHVYLHDDSLKHSVKPATGGVEAIVSPGKSRVYNDDGSDAGIKTVGLFLYRKANGSGSIDWNVKLCWPFGRQNVFEDDPVKVRVFAIEMVYIPEAKFYLGDGSANATVAGTAGTVTRKGYYTFYNSVESTVYNPYQVVSEEPIPLRGNGVSMSPIKALSVIGNGMVTNQSLDAKFPKGFAAFYIMKHEVTQEAYADFLNTLALEQQTNRDINLGTNITPTTVQRFVTANATTKTANVRNGVAFWKMEGGKGLFCCNYTANGWLDDDVNRPNDGQNIAMNYISLGDYLSYLDWACLRPLTELEYEKAARGINPPSKNEMAWGSDNFNPCAYLTDANIANTTTPALRAGTDGQGTEKPSTGNCNIYGEAPIRVGSFADTNTRRFEAGASYYGVMELSGNVTEWYVHVNNYSYVGKHGDGRLDRTNGDATMTNLEWPAYGLTRNYIWRSYSASGIVETVSSRNTENTAYARTSRYSYTGIRGGRSAKPNLD